MTDQRSVEQSCDEVAGQLPELALGILTGRERAAVLAHLSGCARCSAEVEQLSLTADELLGIAPETEPPVGFEVRLFERMELGDPAAVPPSAGVDSVVPLAPRRSRRQAVLAVAAAAVVVLAFFGGWWAERGTAGGPPAGVSATVALTAPLVADGQRYGSVTTLGGKPGWLIMNVTDSNWSGRVECEVTERGGTTLRVGSFWLAAGYGSWSARLPVPAAQVETARVVSSRGAVLATATLAS